MANMIGWKVTSQTETTNISAGGDIAEGIRVGFVLDDGTAGSVFVPLAGYSADKVRAAVAARAAVLGEVATLAAAPETSATGR